MFNSNISYTSGSETSNFKFEKDGIIYSGVVTYSYESKIFGETHDDPGDRIDSLTKIDEFYVEDVEDKDGNNFEEDEADKLIALLTDEVKEEFVKEEFCLE